MVIFKRRHIELFLANFMTFLMYIYTNQIYAQDVIKGGWVYQHDTKGLYKKFFPICVWGLPGYTFTPTKETSLKQYMNGAFVFKKTMESSFNSVYSHWDYLQDYMNGYTIFCGSSEYTWNIERYFENNVDKAGLRGPASYLNMRKLNDHINEENFERGVLQHSTRVLLSKTSYLGKSKVVWTPIDEVANGWGWHFSTDLTNKIYENIQRATKGSVVFIDLMGNIRGNTYLFEKWYLQRKGNLPKKPPFNELLNVYSNTPNSMLGFKFSSNGEQVNRFYGGAFHFYEKPFEIQKKEWLENIRLTSNAYKNSGNVFGLNSYSEFFNHPELAGWAVDAIKDGTSTEMPVWLFFDGNGYAKPNSVSASNYVKNVKCQIYTSIIHGATGVLIWNDLEKESECFKELLPVVKQLNMYTELIKSATIYKNIQGNIHYIVKNYNGNKYVMSVNTKNVIDSKVFRYAKKRYEFSPLEVKVFKL